MDMKKISELLNDKFDDDDLNENDLEDELEAILTGKPSKVIPAPRQAYPVRPEKPSRAAPRKPSNVYKSVGSANNKPPSVNVPAHMIDMSQIEKMLNLDIDNLPESDDHDLDDVDLESELSHIVGTNTLTGGSGGGGGMSSEPIRKPTASLSQIQTFNESAYTSKAPQPPTFESHVVNTTQPSFQSRASVSAKTDIKPQISQAIDQKAQKLTQIKQLQIEYKRAAVKAKTSGDKDAALAHLRISKQLDSMFNSLNANEEVDMSALPPMPFVTSSKATPPIAADTFDAPEVSQEEASQIFNAPKSASSVLEALEQRLAKFKSTQQEAVDQENASKARRLSRLVKQMESSIKDHKAGKPVDYDLLPCPPGFPPIPMPPKIEPTITQPKLVKEPVNPAGPQKSSSSQPAPVQKPPLKRGISTTASKQLTFLRKHQRLFREAALEAKKRGEIEQAKEYLRHAKGFDPLIEATEKGLPIDATSVPKPPQLNDTDDFVVISSENIPSSDSGASTANSRFYTNEQRQEIFRQIEKDLIEQIEMCNRMAENYRNMGDLSSSIKFSKLKDESNQNLLMLRVRWENGENIPSFHIETRKFSIVVSNPGVGVNELQVDIVKAFDLPGQPEIDTYVRVEIPVPSDNPQNKKTKTVYNTISPEYNESFKFDIERKSRSLVRLLKRHPLKLQIFSKGGLFRSDTLIGMAVITVGEELETKSTIHKSVELQDARKKVIPGSRLEFRVKLREPLLAKQIEEIKEKWIVFTPNHS